MYFLYHLNTKSFYSSTLCSPILANIYLNELDKKVREIKKRFEENNDTVRPRKNREYSKIQTKCTKLSKEISCMLYGEDRDLAIQELKRLKASLINLPYTDYKDKGIYYVRYADDWLIGVKGSKAECAAIKMEIKEFLASELKLELSEEKTLITHSSNRIRFLGYDITVRRNRAIRGYRDKSGKWWKRRTLNRKVALLTPMQDRIMSFLFKKKAIIQKPDGTIKAIHRSELINKPDVEVVKTYNSEIRGILNFYCLSDNYAGLDYFVFMMERSCLKTLASKHKTTTRQIRKKYHDGHGWSIPAGSRKKPKRIGIIKFWDYPKKFYSDEIKEYRFYGYKSMLWKRIQKGVCELCNVRMERKGVVHMVRKLKDLGDRPWEQTMKRMRRKTLVVCHSCHNLIHANG